MGRTPRLRSLKRAKSRRKKVTYKRFIKKSLKLPPPPSLEGTIPVKAYHDFLTLSEIAQISAIGAGAHKFNHWYTFDFEAIEKAIVSSVSSPQWVEALAEVRKARAEGVQNEIDFDPPKIYPVLMHPFAVKDWLTDWGFGTEHLENLLYGENDDKKAKEDKAEKEDTTGGAETA